jgi:hypothetical protein
MQHAALTKPELCTEGFEVKVKQRINCGASHNGNVAFTWWVRGRKT